MQCARSICGRDGRLHPVPHPEPVPTNHVAASGTPGRHSGPECGADPRGGFRSCQDPWRDPGHHWTRCVSHCDSAQIACAHLPPFHSIKLRPRTCWLCCCPQPRIGHQISSPGAGPETPCYVFYRCHPQRSRKSTSKHHTLMVTCHMWIKQTQCTHGDSYVHSLYRHGCIHTHSPQLWSS